MRQIQMGIDRLPQTWYKEILTQPPVVFTYLIITIKCSTGLVRLMNSTSQSPAKQELKSRKEKPKPVVKTNITPQRYNRFTRREGRDWTLPGSANEFEKLIASKARTEISIREAEGRDWTLIRKDNGIRVNARWWDAEWDPTASCSEWTLATYTAA
ncbi:hypothetical protein T4E_1424 [Trichinella pseudospiralis]|uniref:Uncharacterized protein n=1 Tax=Trichinella pseudospiralis TaxID=6337 RepID=A0A0V0XTH6_TRIPS|nr:hypothetical protein T4E_1424 [Trichinella pseudospiralis]